MRQVSLRKDHQSFESHWTCSTAMLASCPLAYSEGTHSTALASIRECDDEQCRYARSGSLMVQSSVHRPTTEIEFASPTLSSSSPSLQDNIFVSPRKWFVA